MKLLLTIAILLPLFTFSQSKNSKQGNVSFKMSPGVFFTKNQDEPSFIGLVTLGPVITKSKGASIGFTTGYLKFKGSSKPVIPVGIELSALPYRSKKPSPIVIFGAYLPIYNVGLNGPSGFSTSGKFMANIGGGICFPAAKKSKIALTGNYYPLLIRTIVKSNNSVVASSTSTTNMFAITMNIILFSLSKS
jgi:hypothetical protein